MYAVEFKAHIEDGLVRIPKDYENLYNQDVQIIIIPLGKKKGDTFDPKEFFGASKFSKKEIDQHLSDSKNSWDGYIDEK